MFHRLALFVQHFVIRIVDMVDFEASSMQINPSDYQVYELLTEDQSNRPRPQWLQAHTDPKGAFEHFQAALKQLQNGDTSAALRSMQTHIDANPADDVATQRLLSLKQQSSAQNPGRYSALCTVCSCNSGSPERGGGARGTPKK